MKVLERIAGTKHTNAAVADATPAQPRHERDAQFPVHLSVNSFPLNGGLFLPPAPLPPLTPLPPFYNARQLPHFSLERNGAPFVNPNFFLHGNHKIQSPEARVVGTESPLNAPLNRQFPAPRYSDGPNGLLRVIHQPNFDPNTFHPSGNLVFRNGHPVGDFRPISEILNDRSNVFKNLASKDSDHVKTEHSPITQSQFPSKNAKLPSKNQELLFKNENFPFINQEFSSKNQEFPSKNQELLFKNENFPFINQEFSSKNQEFPSKNQELLFKNENFPFINQEFSSKNQEFPSKNQELLFKNENFPFINQEFSSKNQKFPSKNSFSSRTGTVTDAVDIPSRTTEQKNHREEQKTSTSIQYADREFDADESIAIVKFPSHRQINHNNEPRRSNLESSRRVLLPPEVNLETHVQISDLNIGPEEHSTSEIKYIVQGRRPGQEQFSNLDTPNKHLVSEVNVATESNIEPSFTVLPPSIASGTKNSFSSQSHGRAHRRRPQSKLRNPAEEQSFGNEETKISPNNNRRKFRQRRVQKRPSSNFRITPAKPMSEDTTDRPNANLNSRTQNNFNQTPIDRSDDNFYEDYYDELALAGDDYLYDYYQYYDEFKSILEEEEKSEKVNNPSLDEHELKTKVENEFLFSSEPTVSDDSLTPTTTRAVIEEITENPYFEENLGVTTEYPEDESLGTSVLTSTEETLNTDVVTLSSEDTNELTTASGEITDYDDPITVDELDKWQNRTTVDDQEGLGNTTKVEKEKELSQREEEIVSAAEKHRERLKKPPPKSGRGSFRHRLKLLTQKRKDASQTRDWSPTPPVPHVTKPTLPRSPNKETAPGFITGSVVVRNATKTNSDEPLDFYTRLKYRIFTSPAPPTSQRRSNTKTSSARLVGDEIGSRSRYENTSSGKREHLQRNRKLSISLPDTTHTRSVRRQALSGRNDTLVGIKLTTTTVPTTGIDEFKKSINISNATGTEETRETKTNNEDEDGDLLSNAESLKEKYPVLQTELEGNNETPVNKTLAQSETNVSSTEKEKSILSFLNNLALHDWRGDTSNNNESEKSNVEDGHTTLPSPVYIPSTSTTTQSSDSLGTTKSDNLGTTKSDSLGTTKSDNLGTTKSASQSVVRTTREATATTEVNFETQLPTDAVEDLESYKNRQEVTSADFNELSTISSASSVKDITPLEEMNFEMRSKTVTPSSELQKVASAPETLQQFTELRSAKNITTSSNLNKNEAPAEVEGRSFVERNISSNDLIPTTLIQNIIGRASVINGTDETPKLLNDVLQEIDSSTLNVEQMNGTTSFFKIKRGNNTEPAVKTTITLFTDKFHKIKPQNGSLTEYSFETTLDPIIFETQTNIPALQTKSVVSIDEGIQGSTESSDYTTYSSGRNQLSGFKKKSGSHSPPSAYHVFTTQKPLNQGQSSLSRLKNLLSQFDSSFRPELSMNHFLGIVSDDRISPIPSSRSRDRVRTHTASNRAWSRPNNWQKNSFVDWTSPRGGRSPIDFGSFGSVPQALTNTNRHSLLSSSLDDLSLAASEGNDVNSESPTERNNITVITPSSVPTSTPLVTTENNSFQSTSAIITSLVNDLFSASTTPSEITTTVTTESYITDTEESTTTTELPPEVTTQLDDGELTEEDLKLMEKSNITSIDVEKLLNDTSNSTVPDEFFEEIIEMTKGRLTSEVNNTDEATNVTLQLKQFLLKQREKDSSNITEEEQNSFRTSRDEFLSSDAVRERLRLLRIFKAKKERESGGRTIQKHLRQVKGATKVYQRTDNVDFEDIGVKVSTAVKLRDILNRRHQKKKKEVTTEAVKPTTITPPPSLRSQVEKYMNRNNRKKNAASRPRYENVVKVNGFRVVKGKEEEQDDDNTPTTEADEEMIFSQGTQASTSQDFIPDEVSKASFLPTVPPSDRGTTQQPEFLLSRETSRNMKHDNNEPFHFGQLPTQRQRGQPIRNLYSNRKSNGALGLLEELLVRQTPRSESTSLALKLKSKMSAKFLPTVPPETKLTTFASNVVVTDQKNTEQPFIFVPTAAPEDFTITAESFDDAVAVDPQDDDFYDYYDDTTEPAVEYSYGNVNELTIAGIPGENTNNFQIIPSRNIRNKLENPVDDLINTRERGTVSTGDSVKTEFKEFFSSHNGALSYVEDDSSTLEDLTNEVLTPEPDLFVGGIFQPSVPTNFQETRTSTSSPIQSHSGFSLPKTEQAIHHLNHEKESHQQPINAESSSHREPQSNNLHHNGHNPGNRHHSAHRPLISHTAPITLRQQGVRHVVRPPVKGTDSPRVSPPSALLRETLSRAPRVSPTRATRHEINAGNVRAIAPSTALRNERNRAFQHQESTSKLHELSIQNQGQFPRHHNTFSHNGKVVQQEWKSGGLAHFQGIREQEESSRNGPAGENTKFHQETQQPIGFQERPFSAHHPNVFQRANIFPIVPSQNQQIIEVSGFRNSNNPHQDGRHHSLHHQNGQHQNVHRQSSHLNHFAHLGNQFHRHEPNFLSHNDRQKGGRGELFDVSNSNNLFTSTLEKSAEGSRPTVAIQSHSQTVTGKFNSSIAVDLQAKPVIMNILILNNNTIPVSGSHNTTSPFERFVSKVKSDGPPNSFKSDNVTTFRPAVKFGWPDQQSVQPKLISGPVLQITPVAQSFFGDKSSGNGAVQIPLTSTFETKSDSNLKNGLKTPHIAVKTNSNIQVRQHGTVKNAFTTPTIPTSTTKNSSSKSHNWENKFSNTGAQPTTPRPWSHSLRALETNQNEGVKATGSTSFNSLFSENLTPRVIIENGNFNHNQPQNFQFPKQNREQMHNLQWTSDKQRQPFSQSVQFPEIDTKNDMKFGHEAPKNWHPIKHGQQKNGHPINSQNQTLNGQQIIKENHQQTGLLMRLDRSHNEQKIHNNQSQSRQSNDQFSNAPQIFDQQTQESQKQLVKQEPIFPFLNDDGQSQPTLQAAGSSLIPVASPEVRQTPANFQESGLHHDPSSTLATPRPGFLLPLSKNGNQVTKVTQLMEQGEVPGEPWLNYPAYTDLPSTIEFNCTHHVKEHRGAGHLFPDVNTRCQAYHLCHGGARTSFLCPVGTIFNQVTGVCQWWFQVQCRQPFSAG
ncbi:Chitin binding domain [Trinorchestia longiramus]|nr:Chitin binding domain [Trinorchestia longiramus]